MVQLIKKMNQTVLFVIISCILIFIWWMTIDKFDNYIIESKNILFQSESENAVKHIAEVFDGKMKLSKSLKAFVELQGDGLTQEIVDQYGNSSQLVDENVVNFNIAPDGIIEFAYPKEENEMVIGHNLIMDERDIVQKDILHAIETGKSIITGPVDLIKGGKGIIIRDPIFIDNEFWGFATIVLDAKVITDVIDNYNELGQYQYFISSEDNLFNYGAYFNKEESDIILKIPNVVLDLKISGKINDEFNFLNEKNIRYFKYFSFFVLLLLIYISFDLTHTNKLLSKRVDSMIYFDKLTSLPNRRSLEKRMNEIMGSNTFYLAFADLDDFKYINDTQGHTIGDHLLKQISGVLLKYSTSKVKIYRWGGDEFVFIFENHSYDEVKNLVSKILSEFTNPFKIEENNFKISMSVGIVKYPDDSENIDDLIKSADTAMYSIKEKCKNGFVFFNDISTDAYYEKIAISNRMKDKNFVNDLVVHYQPKVQINNNKIMGMEALVRLKNDDGTLISPDKFIKIAEDKGYINLIDRFVINKVFSESKGIIEQYGLKVSINLSAKNINWDFVKYIEEQMAIYNIESRYIEFELTETAAIQNIESVVEILVYLNSLGISIAIDDFGKGYGALNYLLKFPIATIKIDKEFIDDIMGNVTGNKIIESIIELSKNLGIVTVAEGVESYFQLDYLKTIKCDDYQGYLYCKPVPYEKFIEIIKTREC